MANENNLVEDSKETESYHSGENSDGEGAQQIKFDFSQYKRMFIPSFGYLQRSTGNPPSELTKKLLDDAISIESSDKGNKSDQKSDYKSRQVAKAGTSEKDGHVRKKHRNSKSRQDAQHKRCSLNGKEREINEKDSTLIIRVSESQLQDENPTEQPRQDIANSKSRKRERRSSNRDRRIKEAIQMLSEEVHLGEKEVLLRACKMMLTCKQEPEEKTTEMRAIN